MSWSGWGTVLQRFRDLSLAGSDDLSLSAAIRSAPDGGKIVGVVVSDIGAEGEGERAIRSLRELGPVLMDTVARMPYCALQRQVDAMYPKGQRHYWKTGFLKSLTDDALDLLIETVSKSPPAFEHHPVGGIRRCGLSCSE